MLYCASCVCYVLRSHHSDSRYVYKEMTKEGLKEVLCSSLNEFYPDLAPDLISLPPTENIHGGWGNHKGVEGGRDHTKTAVGEIQTVECENTDTPLTTCEFPIRHISSAC